MVAPTIPAMPLDASIVGRTVGSRRVVVDARWLMAYAAGVPDARPELYDTRGDLGMHPMFPVAPEWELVIGFRRELSGLRADEASRGVHAAHDVIVERPVRAGEELELSGRVAAVVPRRGGAEQRVRFEARDDDGALVWRSMMTSVFRGVEVVGEPTTSDPGVLDADDEWPALPEPIPADAPPVTSADSVIGPLDAHTYTECARIWNPIHTDVAYAQRAGLHAPILHGTATLARGVTIATNLAGVPLDRVRRVTGRFAAMVDLDTTITVRLLRVAADAVWFDVRNAAGDPAVLGGSLGLRN